MNVIEWDKTWLLETTITRPTSLGDGIIDLIPTKVTLRKLSGALTRRIEGLVDFHNGHVEKITVHIYEGLAKIKVRKGKKLTCAITTNVVRKRIFDALTNKHIDNMWTRSYVICVENIKRNSL